VSFSWICRPYGPRSLRRREDKGTGRASRAPGRGTLQRCRRPDRRRLGRRRRCRQALAAVPGAARFRITAWQILVRERMSSLTQPDSRYDQVGPRAAGRLTFSERVRYVYCSHPPPAASSNVERRCWSYCSVCQEAKDVAGRQQRVVSNQRPGRFKSTAVSFRSNAGSFRIHQQIVSKQPRVASKRRTTAPRGTLGFFQRADAAIELRVRELDHRVRVLESAVHFLADAGSLAVQLFGEGQD